LDSDGKLRRNFEHASSEANAEFQSSSNLHVYSFKSEGEWRDLIYHGALNNPGVALWVRNCSQVLPLLAPGFGNNFFFFHVCSLQRPGERVQLRRKRARHGDGQDVPGR
jgi:hypothetical protein